MRNPKTEFVASFIGSPPMNFLPVDIAGAAPAGAARLGVRPEHMEISGSTDARVQAQVLYTEALGAETLVHARLADGTLVTVRQDATAPRPKENATVGVGWNASNQMLFDASGRAIEKA